MELMLEDIVGVLTCTPCAVHFNCYEIVPQLWKSTFMCEQDTCTCSKVYYYYVLIRYSRMRGVHREWMENMCTSCSCSKHTCSLKALFLHIKGCDNLCLIGTLLSITCSTLF